MCVCRLSLADGLFMAPLQSRSPAVNACGVAPAHGLVGCAGEDGWLECFDLRQRRSVGAVNAAAAVDAVRPLPPPAPLRPTPCRPQLAPVPYHQTCLMVMWQSHARS